MKFDDLVKIFIFATQEQKHSSSLDVIIDTWNYNCHFYGENYLICDTIKKQDFKTKKKDLLLIFTSYRKVILV